MYWRAFRPRSWDSCPASPSPSTTSARSPSTASAAKTAARLSASCPVPCWRSCPGTWHPISYPPPDLGPGRSYSVSRRRLRHAQPGMPLGARLLGELAGCGIEARQIIVLLVQQPHETGHAVEVGRNRGEARVVQPGGDPFLVQRIGDALTPLERADVAGKLRKDFRLLHDHLIAGQR